METDTNESAVEKNTNEHVLTKTGEFIIHDQAVDLKQYSFEDWISFGLFWILTVIIFYQFFTRYALNNSAAWTEEIARYLLICITCVPAAICVRKNNHIQVDYFYRIFPKLLMRIVSTVVDITRVLINGYCVYLTWQLMGKIGRLRMVVVNLPMGLVYSVVLFGFALMTWRSVGVLIANWKRGASILEQPEFAELER